MAPCGGVQAAMSGFWFPEGGASLVLCLAVALVLCIPFWALLLWMATSSLLLRWMSEGSWKRWLFPLAMFAAVLGGAYGFSWMGSLVSRPRSTERVVIAWVWGVNEFVAVIALIVVAWARASSGVGTASGTHGKRRRGRAVVLAWGVLAVVLVALRAGPLGGESASSSDWWALAASSGALVAVIALLITAIIEARKRATGSGPVETTSGG